MTPKKPQQMLKLVKIEVLWLNKTFGGTVVGCMPNSGHGGLPGTQVMTTLIFFAGPNFPNIRYFGLYGGILKHIKVFGIYEGI